MQQTVPEDILVLLVQQWLRNHAGSATNSTELIKAPNIIATGKSCLSKEFQQLRRTGDWNPVEGLHLRNFVKGYKNHAAELGYQERGAVPFEEADMIHLLQQLYLQQHLQAQIKCCY